MKVLVYRNEIAIPHSTDWSFPWIEYLKDNRINYDVIDIMRVGNVVELLKGYDVLLWHFAQYNFAEMLEARSILNVAESLGVKVFPAYKENWHFDDKVAEMYALQAVNAPIPTSIVFYDYENVKRWAEEKGRKYPIVAKLRTGSGSHNVKLIKSKSSLLNYAKTMFGSGFNPAPSILYKTTSNVRSSHDWTTFKKKMKRVPEFFRTLSGAKKFPNEKGYVYLQEFVPNDNYDMKVVVVGDKCAGLIRPVRSHDFRASGGGEVFFEKKYFTKDIIESAFRVADALGTQCIGFDYVVNKDTGQSLIIEMSYGFSHEAVMSSGGYFDRNCQWHDEEFNAPKELLINILKNEEIK